MDRKREALKRKHRLTFMLNEEEMKSFQRFCSDYGVRNKSGFIRESIFSKLIYKFEVDYPTLFDEEEMDRMIVKRTYDG